MVLRMKRRAAESSAGGLKIFACFGLKIFFFLGFLPGSSFSESVGTPSFALP
eukprot:CAMPEP_0171263292 /NCGR_PEP_ID=MMETSP0790-20130122/57023_1 /TAXON_ID=2925 /ORGANISM="Alexandrium catenella, Strain OF101" /LENGTH=51 /DNA_ID=CAMNT_0011731903 /DNA_START=82 /DNA_END=233 /DNA_ORIENTATION=-